MKLMERRRYLNNRPESEIEAKRPIKYGTRPRGTKEAGLAKKLNAEDLTFDEYCDQMDWEDTERRDERARRLLL